MNHPIQPVVIGAGISGLSCAYALVRRGANPIICEPGIIGGVIRSSIKDGFTLEHGPNVFLAKDSLMQMIREIGLEESVVEPISPKYQQFVWYKGKPTPVPKGLVALLKTPLIDCRFKLLLPFNLLRSDLISGLSQPVSVADLFSKIIGRSGGAR